jgi:hypothetical protein
VWTEVQNAQTSTPLRLPAGSHGQAKVQGLGGGRCTKCGDGQTNCS